MLSPGERFGGYTIEAVVGRGGTSTVYRARESCSPGRTVALKVLNGRPSQPEAIAGFDREFAIGHRLTHPHIVSVFDHGPGWLTMEFVPGGPVTRLPTLPERLTALAQIAGALDYLHGQSVVHCDVKPANMLLRDDFPRRGAALADFGSAHVLGQAVPPRTAHVTASLPYSAPELLLGAPVGAATDEYALVCSAVELVTGSPPFVAPTSMALTSAHLSSPPPRVARRSDWLPNAFDSIVAKALAKRPEQRYATCVEPIALITRLLRL
ncbi:serine/threonine protein kinase [Mycolicibacterium sp. 018/SC-01/001]|uniref:serine/threonine-protein kinase n=1 Tax=Mycolicibacterium sp. 018/SC-01/001 TaxID=2592069 RepID=UPI00117FFCD5|nr:serine/threonine-protein kinase [Mycolicibacterium sp. 018/SC-01/001]TRW78291.1 serine/threonine protein kinase [Mycolicibacterium sp. 018/SC-01/001]